jgi:hypothetical protein
MKNNTKEKEEAKEPEINSLFAHLEEKCFCCGR